MKFLMAVLLCVGFSSPTNASTSVDPVTALVSSGMFGVGAAAEIHARRVLEGMTAEQIHTVQSWSRYRVTESEYIRKIREALIRARVNSEVVHTLIGMTHHTTFEDAYAKALKFAEDNLPKDSQQKLALTQDLKTLASDLEHTYSSHLKDQYRAMSSAAAKYNNKGLPGYGRLKVGMDVRSSSFGRDTLIKGRERAVVGKGPAFVRGLLLLGGAAGLGYSLDTDDNDAYRGTPQYYDTNVEPIDEDSVGSFGE